MHLKSVVILLIIAAVPKHRIVVSLVRLHGVVQFIFMTRSLIAVTEWNSLKKADVCSSLQHTTVLRATLCYLSSFQVTNNYFFVMFCFFY